MATKLKRFGDFHLACSSDKLRPEMQLASFQDGFIKATNGHILVISKLSGWSAVIKESIYMSEGKGLHMDKLKKLAGAKVHKIEFTDNTVISMDSSNKIIDIMFWDSIPSEKEKGMSEFTDNMGNPNGDTFRFVNFDAVIPTEFKYGGDQLDKCTPVLNPELLTAVFKCLPDADGFQNLLGCRVGRFSEALNRPLIVTPPEWMETPRLEQFGIIMPVFKP